MRKFQLFLIIFIFFFSADFQFAKEIKNITINVVAPYSGFNTGDTLFIYCAIASTEKITSVIGIVENDTITLNDLYNGYFRAFLNLSKQKLGLKVLTIVAENNIGEREIVQRNFKFDKPPKLVVSSPQTYYSVEKKMLKISASCTDDDSAYIPKLDLYINSKAITKTSSRIDTVIDLNEYLQKGKLNIKLVATDSDKKTDVRYFVVYIEPFDIMDRELTLKKSVTALSDSIIIVGDSYARSIYDITMQKYTDIPTPKNMLYNKNSDYLYKNFLLFSMKGKNVVTDSIYFYKGGALKGIDYFESYSARGFNLIFNKNSQLHLFNFLLGQSTHLIDSVLNENNDVTEDGSIAATTVSYTAGINNSTVNILKNNQKVLIDNDNARFPATDGNTIVYAKGAEPRSIYLYKNGSKKMLCDNVGDITQKFWYAVNKGWVAYTKLGDAGQRVIHLIDPSGRELSISDFLTDCYIIDLSDDGRVVFWTDGYYFVGGKNLPSIRFANNEGLIRWTSDGFYYTVGPFVYKVLNQKLHLVDERNTIKSFELKQNYPNPFNPVTNISFSVPSECNVKIAVFDVLGREVKTLLNEKKLPGVHSVIFNGVSFASGVYFYRIEAGSFNGLKKMIILK